MSVLGANIKFHSATHTARCVDCINRIVRQSRSRHSRNDQDQCVARTQRTQLFVCSRRSSRTVKVTWRWGLASFDPGGPAVPLPGLQVLRPQSRYASTSNISCLIFMFGPVPVAVATVKSEPDLHPECPPRPMDTDVLEWWSLNEMKFSALSDVARHYLGVPATSGSEERLFSIAGRIFDDLR